MTRWVKIAVVIGALAAAACTSHTTLPVELPAEEGMQTIVVGYAYGDVFRLFAYDLETFDPNAVPPLDPVEGPTTLYTIYYEAPLDFLRIGREELRRANMGAPDRALPPFQAAYRSLADADGAGPWQRIDNDPDAIAFRLLDEIDISHCFELEVQRFENPVKQPMTAAVAVSDEEVYGFAQGGPAIRVTPLGIEPLTITPTITVTAGALAADGEILLGDYFGRVYRGHPDRGFVLDPRVNLESDVRSMSSGPNPTRGNEQVFVLGGDNSGARLLDDDWRFSDPVGEATHALRGTIVWAGDRRAAVLPVQGDVFALIENGQTRIHLSNQLLLTKLTALTRLDSGQVVLATEFGGILEGTDAGLRFSRQYDGADGVLDMAPLEQGFVFIRAPGKVIYGELDRDQCPEFDLEAGTRANSMAPMGQRRVVAFTTTSTRGSKTILRSDVLLIGRR